MLEEKESSSLSKAFNYAKVGFFALGHVFSSVGQIVYSIGKTFDYLGITAKSKNNLVVVSIVSTGYMRLVTRIPALTQLFTTKKSENKKTNLALSRATIILGLIALIAALVDTIQAYYSTDEFLKYFGNTVPWVTYTLGGYTSFARMVAYIAFYGMTNITSGLDVLNYWQNRQQNVGRLKFKPFILTFLVTGAGNFAIAANAYFIVYNFFHDFTPERANKILSSIALVDFFTSSLLSRIAKTFEYFNSEKALDLRRVKPNCLPVLSSHLIFGSVDNIVFGLAFYSGSVFVLEQLEFPSNSYFSISFSSFAAFNAGFMHYIYAMRPLLKKQLIAEEPASPLNVQQETKAIPRISSCCCSFLVCLENKSNDANHESGFYQKL